LQLVDWRDSSVEWDVKRYSVIAHFIIQAAASLSLKTLATGLDYKNKAQTTMD